MRAMGVSYTFSRRSPRSQVGSLKFGIIGITGAAEFMAGDEVVSKIAETATLRSTPNVLTRP